MIIVKKKLSKKDKSNLKSKVKDYLELSKNKAVSSRGSFMAASLKSVIPLAAAAVIPGQQLSAQCLESGTHSLVGQGCFYADAGFYGIDVDGDGSFDLGWGAPQYVASSYTGTATTSNGAMVRNLFLTLNTTFLMFGVGGGSVAPSAFPSSSSFACSAVGLTAGTAVFWASSRQLAGVQTYPVGGTTWVTTTINTTSSSSIGNIPVGPYAFPIQSTSGSCGWIELTYGFIGGRTAMCFDSGGVEDASGGDDGLGIVHVGECESLALTLPVQLSDINATAGDNNIEVSWATIAEVNNKGFEIQRSLDGNRFQKLGFIEGKMNSFTEEQYTFDDNSAQANTLYYYRLKQIDVNGEFEFSRIVNAKIEAPNRFTISDFFPNPSTTKEVSFEVNLAEDQNITLEIFDAYGSKVYTDTYNGVLGNNLYKLNLVELSSGAYFTKIVAGENTKYNKLIIQ
jgi:hypothetical protein